VKGFYQTHKKFVLLAAMALLLSALAFGLVSCSDNTYPKKGETNPGFPRDNTPVVLQATQPGTAVEENSKVVVDYSNISEGYICVKSFLGGTKVKVLVEVAGLRYQYTIQNTDRFITIPLSEGNGVYTVGVYEHVEGDLYAAILSLDGLSVRLDDEFSVFLYPNQVVNFSMGDKAVQLSEKLADGTTSELEALNEIYQWVASNIKYDEAKAALATAGALPNYIPNNTSTIDTKTGICFDYAVLTVSMLRAQRIPARLVIGYAGGVYHAWIEVYSVETGSIGRYRFTGTKWVQMDPTFDAANKGVVDLSGLIGSGTDYQKLFYH